MKKLFQYLPQNSAAYVILHAIYRRSRGRRPIATFGSERNPRKALQYAQMVVSTGTILIKPTKPCTVSIIKQVMDRLGLRGLTVDEAKKLFEVDRVPCVSWNSNKLNLDWLDSGRNFGSASAVLAR